MRLSSKSQYGLKACFILAQNYPSRCISASMLEKEIAVSAKYIEKIMRMLSGAGVVTAERGVSGGYKLTRAPEKITIGDVARRPATSAPRARYGANCTRASTPCSIP